MPVLRCPNCNVPMTESEAKGGACPSCAVGLGNQPAGNEEDYLEGPASHLGRCLACDQITQVQDKFLRVHTASFWGNFLRALIPALISGGAAGAAYAMRTYQVHVSCRCCRPCQGKVNRVRWRGWLLIALWLGFPILLCSGLVAVLGPGHPQADTAIRWCLVAIGAVWILSPFLVHYWIKRRLRAVLHPDTIAWLKALPVDWRPGLGSFLVFLKERPAGEVLSKL